MAVSQPSHLTAVVTAAEEEVELVSLVEEAGEEERTSSEAAAASSCSAAAAEEAEEGSVVIKAAGVQVKEEELDEEGEGVLNYLKGGFEGGEVGNSNGGGGGGGSSSTSATSSVVVTPKPMEGLNDSGPPPFLKKTFEMVDDGSTDAIVSWSKNRGSFVVWDSHEFSKHLLPKYFKHSNFSSFIRQLNTYGFRKIDPDRWEFANEGFQGGKRHLLKNIKRRSRYNKQQQQQQVGVGAMPSNGADIAKPRLETEFESLKNDQDLLKLEILKLRQKQVDSDSQLVAVEERIRAAECKQLQRFMFFAKATRSPGFIQRLIQKRKLQQLDYSSGEMGKTTMKKRRLLPTPHQTLPVDDDDINCRNQARHHLATMQTELDQVLPADHHKSEMTGTGTGASVSKLFSAAAPVLSVDEFHCPVDDHQTEAAADDQDISSVYDLMSEDLLEDDDDDDPVVVDNTKTTVDDEDLDMNDSKFYLELEDLLGSSSSRPSQGWSSGCVAAGLVGHAGCG